MNNRLSRFVLCLISLCLFAFWLEPLEARAEEPDEVTSEELSETTAESSSACICRIDVTAYSNLPDNCISVKTDLGKSKVQYKVGKSKWKSVTGLERDEAGSYLISTTAGKSVSVKVKKGKDVVGTNASFGIDNPEETRNGGMRPPYGFNHSAFMKDLFADGFSFAAEDGARVVVELTMENNGPGSSPADNPKYYVYFDKNATVSKDGKTVTTKGPSGEKIVITIDGAKVEDGRVGVPEDESRVVFYMGGDFNPKKMSVYVMEWKENLKYDPMLIDLYVATGSNAVTLAKHWPENGHFTNEMTFGIGGDPAKTYTPSTPFLGPDAQEKESDSKNSSGAAEGQIYRLVESGEAQNNGSGGEEWHNSGSGESKEGQNNSSGESKTAIFLGTTSSGTKLSVRSKIRVYNNVYEVTAIEKNACKDNRDLKTVVIPSTVTKIGTAAFSGASNLGTVRISAPAVIAVGKNAFSGIKPKASFKITAESPVYKKIKKKIASAGAPSDVVYKRIKP